MIAQIFPVVEHLRAPAAEIRFETIQPWLPAKVNRTCPPADRHKFTIRGGRDGISGKGGLCTSFHSAESGSQWAGWVLVMCGTGGWEMVVDSK